MHAIGMLVSWATGVVKATKPVSVNLNNLAITGPGPDRMPSGSSSLKRPSDYCGITTAITLIERVTSVHDLGNTSEKHCPYT